MSLFLSTFAHIFCIFDAWWWLGDLEGSVYPRTVGTCSLRKFYVKYSVKRKMQEEIVQELGNVLRKSVFRPNKSIGRPLWRIGTISPRSKKP